MDGENDTLEDLERKREAVKLDIEALYEMTLQEIANNRETSSEISHFSE